MLELDHLAVSGESLEAAVAHVEDALGVAMGAGGQHAHFGTHNRLLGLGDGLYLEAIAVDPDVASLPYKRWFDLDRLSGAPRLGNWICRSDKLVTDVAGMAGVGLDVGQPVALTRGDLRWRMAVSESGELPFDDMFPGADAVGCCCDARALLAPSGCRLLRLEVAHPEAYRLRQVVGLADTRVVFVEGAAELRAQFETPHGERVLQ